MCTHMGGTSAMSAASNQTVTANAATHTLTFSVPGVTKVDVDVSYTGTPAELKRADQITAVLVNNILSSQQTTNMASLIDNPNMSPATWASVRTQQMQVLRDNGYPETGDGYRQFALDRSGALRFIRGAATAQDVIDKYGAKVPAGAAIPGRIRGAR